MKTIEISGLHFGENLPKICVPLTGGGMPALLSEISYVKSLPADLYEWRADHYFGSFSEALRALRDGLSHAPLLVTVRTKTEGGKSDLPPEAYEAFLSGLLDQGGFQLLDVELSCGEERVRRLIEKCRKKGVGAVVSRHCFAHTPEEDEMICTLERMKELGADLPKMAVMPKTPQDVLALLNATLRASEKIGPVITMSMGNLGKLSRVSGEVFGSCVTFAAGQEASAPGQLNAEDLRAILEDLSLLQ
ncbi:MAG: type I 3-dehydroquinate dehydratase [Acutalibacter sp.]|nr:type I 3-dehydroquinate dehydratase [Acutalibacter sp.]